MNEQIAPRDSAPSLGRRTVLKGAAWATPVIAVATAVPAVSATTAGRDLSFSGHAMSVNGANEAGTARRIEQGIVSYVLLRDSSWSATPASAVLTFSFDSRWHSALEVTQSGSALSPVGQPTQNGNVLEYSFAVTLPLTGEPDLRLETAFTPVGGQLPYYEDLEPFTARITGSDTDPDTSNNTLSQPAVHVSSWDAQAEATWEQWEVMTADGPQMFSLPATATLTALAPGLYPSYADSDDSNQMIVHLPQEIVDSVEITSVTLNGTPRPGFFGAPTVGSWGYWFPLNEAIPEGAVVRVAFAVTPRGTDQTVPDPSSSVGLVSNSRERDSSNNTAHAPQAV